MPPKTAQKSRLSDITLRPFDFYVRRCSLNFQQAEAFVLREDFAGFVAVQVNGEAVGVEAKLFGHLQTGKDVIVFFKL